MRAYRPHVVTTYNDFGGYGHPDHIRTHDVAVRAFPRAGDPAWYPEQLAPEHGGSGPASAEGGLAPWSPLKLYETAIPESTRRAMQERMAAAGESWWSPPEGATPEELAEFEARMARMLVPDSSITAWVDVSGEPLERKWRALNRHVTQMSPSMPFMRFGIEGWREYWSTEAFVLRESRVAVTPPEHDLFEGVPEDAARGPTRELR
jgi:mycothiol S-conjugate amidase